MVSIASEGFNSQSRWFNGQNMSNNTVIETRETNTGTESTTNIGIFCNQATGCSLGWIEETEGWKRRPGHGNFQLPVQSIGRLPGGPVNGSRFIRPYDYHLVMTNIAIEHDHRNSGFTHWTWWFSIVFLYVYQKVPTFFMKRGADCPAKEKAWRPKRRNDQRYGSAIPRSVFWGN